MAIASRYKAQLKSGTTIIFFEKFKAAIILNYKALSQNHLFNRRLIVVSFLVTGFRTLPESVISLSVKESFLIKAGLLKAVVNLLASAGSNFFAGAIFNISETFRKQFLYIQSVDSL